MIVCPSCSHENLDLAVICGSCKGYLQNRVVNLDLFATAWGILESPRSSFRRVALSEHKNYALTLHGLFGIVVMFRLFWHERMGLVFGGLLETLIWGSLAGIVFGLLTAPLLAMGYRTLVRILGGTVVFRNAIALIAYAMIPMCLSLVTLFPVELITFGLYLFTSNPGPLVLNPVSFYALTGLKILLGIWTAYLLVVAGRVVAGLSLLKSAIVSLLFAGFYLGAFAVLSPLLRSLFVILW